LLWQPNQTGVQAEEGMARTKVTAPARRADAAPSPDLDKLRHGIESAFERLARGV
jgi:hypothetical protein